MRTSLKLPISAALLATALVACGKSKDTASQDDFKRDLQLASATNLDLAGGKADPKNLTFENKPSGAPEASRVVKKGAGSRAVASKTPSVRATPDNDVASTEEEGASETSDVAPAPEHSEPVAVAPRPAPVNIPASAGGDYGNAGGGVLGGGMGGVVIRGGGVDGDHCQPHGGTRRGGTGVYFPGGGVFIPRQEVPRTSGGISIAGRTLGGGGSASSPRTTSGGSSGVRGGNTTRGMRIR